MHRPVVFAALLLSLAACATETPPRRGPAPGRFQGGPARQGEGGPPRAVVFISPAGEPFRGRPGGIAPMQSWFDKADADHNGGISRAEFVDDHMRFFRLLDTNGDGYIAGPESTRYEEEIAPELLSALDRGLDVTPGGGGQRGGPGGGRRGGRGGGRSGPRFGFQGGDDGVIRLPQPGPAGGRGRGGGAPGQGAAPGRPSLISLFGEPEPVRAADTDVDFRVSVAEWTAMANHRFDLLDTDHNGVLLFADLKPQALGGQGRPGGGGGAPRRGGR